VFGYYVSALNRLEILFGFASRLQKISKLYLENMAVQTSLKNFEDIIKEVAKTKMTAFDSKRRKEEE